VKGSQGVVATINQASIRCRDRASAPECPIDCLGKTAWQGPPSGVDQSPASTTQITRGQEQCADSVGEDNAAMIVDQEQSIRHAVECLLQTPHPLVGCQQMAP
jgi:hypothetical protein